MIAKVELGHATLIAIHETGHNKSILFLSINLEVRF